MAQLLAAARQDTPASSASIRSTNIGYFDPGAKDPTAARIITNSEITKYTNVYAFINRLKHLAQQQFNAEVRRVWTQCLLGPAVNFVYTLFNSY
ncbi:hypothetical protein O1611_g4372 [Lasiodiplodia mahajangana]|uniref:Uncharacterized protein n=1 Tax=Lasiodiplodia mahajangana TaxID=1108764 RepID=A0ACC2JP26_9PEZI|nr:hypothetical protein O1611_g4372 [Lasiodiplodia mahajangana]